MTDNPVWLTTNEASTVLGIGVREIYRLIDDGAIPATKFGRRIRIRRDDLDDIV